MSNPSIPGRTDRNRYQADQTQGGAPAQPLGGNTHFVSTKLDPDRARCGSFTPIKNDRGPGGATQPKAGYLPEN